MVEWVETRKLLADPHVGSNYAMVDYGYLPVRDTTDPEADENVAALHTWILDSPIYKQDTV